MIKEIRTKIPKYGKYFLSMEADDEETPKKSNTKVIDVKPNNRRRIDFTDGADETEPAPEEPSEETPIEDNTSDIDTDTQDMEADDTPVDDNAGADIPDSPDTSTSDEPMNDTGSDGTEPTVDDNGTEVDASDGGEEEGPDTSTDADFNDDSGDGSGGEEETSDDNGGDDDSNNDDNKKGPDLGYDSTRKYVLYENYLSLANAIKNYISKLENQIGEDLNQNHVIKTTTEKLREIYDLCYDYMTLKYESSTYVQSLLFFQNLIIMVQMSFELLEKTKKNIKK